jgi:4-amino-4-deoxy-L-arabinose transferase-like glycosyltransferase
MKGPKPKTKQRPSSVTPLSRVLASLDPTGKKNGTPTLSARSALLCLTALVGALLLVFLNRPVHIDDPLFIWAARHIQAHPENPYGFMVNWDGVNAPMSDVTKNPPLTSYYIAAAALVAGWSERGLRLAFMPIAIATAIGTYLIADRFCRRPLLATLATILTPVFFVSSLTFMSDVLMLALWLFAVYFWMVGMDTESHRRMFLGAVLATAAALAKYFGIALIPLLLLYSVFKTRRFSLMLLYLLIPVSILGGYHMATQQLFGRGLLLDAASFATGMNSDFSKFPITKTFVAFTFTGGCIATVLFFSRQLWSRRMIIGLAFITR